MYEGYRLNIFEYTGLRAKNNLRPSSSSELLTLRHMKQMNSIAINRILRPQGFLRIGPLQPQQTAPPLWLQHCDWATMASAHPLRHARPEGTMAREKYPVVIPNSSASASFKFSSAEHPHKLCSVIQARIQPMLQGFLVSLALLQTKSQLESRGNPIRTQKQLEEGLGTSWNALEWVPRVSGCTFSGRKITSQKLPQNSCPFDSSLFMLSPTFRQAHVLSIAAELPPRLVPLHSTDSMDLMPRHRHCCTAKRHCNLDCEGAGGRLCPSKVGRLCPSKVGRLCPSKVGRFCPSNPYSTLEKRRQDSCETSNVTCVTYTHYPRWTRFTWFFRTDI